MSWQQIERILVEFFQGLALPFLNQEQAELKPIPVPVSNPRQLPRNR